MLNISGDAAEFIAHFCGSEGYTYNGKDRRTIKQIDSVQVDGFFKKFLDTNKEKIVDLIVRNGYDITSVVIKNTKTEEYELTYQQILIRLKMLNGFSCIHLKNAEGVNIFSLSTEGKKKLSNRYNVLWYIHCNLFV